MPSINEIKENMVVVGAVGDFTAALQQIALVRMVRTHNQVEVNRPYVEMATAMSQELYAIQAGLEAEAAKKATASGAGSRGLQPLSFKKSSAVIVITSNQGLTGTYNNVIYKKVEAVIEQEKDSDFFVIGRKGQEYFKSG